jgi:hypothetical protein
MTFAVIHVKAPPTGPPEPFGTWYTAFIAVFCVWWLLFGRDMERKKRRRTRVRC